jgi:beta-lactamase class A
MKLIAVPLTLAISTTMIAVPNWQLFKATASDSNQVLVESSNLPRKNNLQVALDNLNISSNPSIGIGILDLNTGKSWFRNRQQKFPMQSVYKLPIAIAVLKRVDERKISLDQSITITKKDFSAGHNPIIKDIKGDRAQFTIRDLLNRMMSVSDNTAADVLMRLIGGPFQVNQTLVKLGVRNVRVDRLERQLQPDSAGLTAFQPEWSDAKTFQAAIDQAPATVKQTALQKYLSDPRDTATPAGLVDLLSKLQSQKLLSANSTAVLLQIMTNSKSGAKRLKAGLPQNWSIAHKTGTGADVLGVGVATNDVGIITSPQGKRIAIAVMIPGSKAPMEERERLMSKVVSLVVQAN